MNIEQVLSEGNDAGGKGIVNLNSIAIVDANAETFTLTRIDGGIVDIQLRDESSQDTTILNVNPNQGVIIQCTQGVIASTNQFSAGVFCLTAIRGENDQIAIIGDSNGINISLPAGASLRVLGLPTSPDGLPSGSLWRNGNVINIV